MTAGHMLEYTVWEDLGSWWFLFLSLNILIIKRDFIVIFPYMHSVYLDKIHPCYYFLFPSHSF
jgi:hypothetical protein